ncbi:metal-dependent phosphohydrolase [Acidihalobacter yilgarnensis]|uniref:Metal-dependent phosphohydrolase n=1 Tax=Acidihalobacter yilgarnensis TaxID=2819280 RepID=A0A1D8IL35_9GAMM|nr:HD-GYP domain-containing protein [Acidihalobacter yilgarnensis]AOU97186.1 metal-dependent phosphohydrolase [Acidihalobacter yilgarnensis]
MDIKRSDESGDLRLSEVIGALSHALDMTEGQPPGHCLRCCWIGMHIGAEMALSGTERADLYYTLLLKDAGCSSNAARLWELYGGDDRLIKEDFKRIDSQSILQLGRFVLNHAAPSAALRERFHRVLNLVRHGNDLATELVATRCERGADIALQLGFSAAVADGIRSLDEHWNGQGRPRGLIGEAIPLQARIALIAQVIDVFHLSGGPDAALAEVRGRAGQWFDPALTAALERVSRQPGFWMGLADAGIPQRVADLEPAESVMLVDEDRLDGIAAAFGQVVDAKSPYTYGHSARVARFAEAIASRFELPPARRRWLRRGALLHDIGKLGVSNGVLDKPGALDANEWEQMRAHARYTEEILARIGLFGELAKVAGAHHERLDGKGYPHGLMAEEISLETRIITTADIFDAITAERPYRGAIPVPEALRIMRSQIGNALDGCCLDALESVLPALDLA